MRKVFPSRVPLGESGRMLLSIPAAGRALGTRPEAAAGLRSSGKSSVCLCLSGRAGERPAGGLTAVSGRRLAPPPAAGSKTGEG
jgi:hypothetical protein